MLNQLIGVATVIDGDTIDIRGQRIRLHGIDAPESSQWCTDEVGATVRCGQQAALALDSLLDGQTCRCEVVDTDRYGRAVATCYVGKLNINEWMVQHGWALAYRKYSQDYVPAEQQARAEGRGIWQYEFEAPWEYRISRRPARPSPRASTASGATGQTLLVVEDPTKEVTFPQLSGACTIKGNVNSKGERIYHTKNSPWYERTQIDESKGERWFCSEEEARQAGWRAAQR